VKIKEIIFLVLILLCSLFLRLWRLDVPQSMYFDEVYHVPAVQMLARGDFRTPFEWWHRADWPTYFDWLHPPLAKYIQALSLRLLSFWPTVVVWRLPSVVFALLSLTVFYFLAKELSLIMLSNKSIQRKILQRQNTEDQAINFALIASVLLASDGLFLVQSRIAMNDIFYLFFSLMASYLYLIFLRQKNLLIFFSSALMLALALATKWSAMWLIIFLLLSELWRIKKEKKFQKIPFVIFSLLLMPVAVYLLVFIPYFLSGKTVSDFIQLQSQIINFQFNYASPHPYQSGPLAWLINWRPVWYFADFSLKNWRQDIYAQGNPVVFLYLLLLIPFLWWWKKSFKTQRLKKQWQEMIFQKPYRLVIAIFFSSFLPWAIINRPLFFYHFLPALPYLILLIAWPVYLFSLTLKSKEQKRVLIFHFLFWPVLAMAIFYPHWTALAVPEQAAHYLYFLLPSWR